MKKVLKKWRGDLTDFLVGALTGTALVLITLFILLTCQPAKALNWTAFGLGAGISFAVSVPIVLHNTRMREDRLYRCLHLMGCNAKDKDCQKTIYKICYKKYADQTINFKEEE